MATSKTKIQKSDNDSDNFLNVVMFRYFPYWPLFILLIAIFGAMAWAYLRFYAVPAYRSTATILVKDQNKGVEDSKTIESLDAVSAKKIVENEMEVISSRELIAQVVKNLNLYSPVYEEEYLRSVSAYLTSPVIISVKETADIVPQKKVYFSFKDNDNQVVIGNNSYALDQWVNTPFGVLKFSRNAKKNDEAHHPLYFSLIPENKVINDIATALKVAVSGKQSSVINLAFDEEVPQKGKDILNSLIKAYNEASLNEKNALAKSTLAFLDSRVKVVKNQLDSIERSVQDYKSSHGIVDLSEQSKMFIQSAGANDSKLTEINTQLSVLDQVEQYVTAKDNKGNLVPATLGISDPTLSQSLEKLYTAELQYENLKKSSGENNPLVSSIASQIERIRPNILETIRSTRKNLQASKGSLASSNSDYISKLQTIPGKERELTEIERQKDILNQVYSTLLNKREETALIYANSIPDSKIVDWAAASLFPVSPKGVIVYLAAVIIAVLICVSYISLKEFFTNKIIFRSEIEEFTSVPVIAEITHVPKRNFFVRKSGKMVKMAVAEQFRQLRMALRLYRKQATKKRLIVTSSIGGEGKSFISSNIAKSLASSGKKVVLIDFDMRNPKTSALFNLVDQHGIKEYLEEEKDVKDILQKTEHDNLYVIPAGNPAINPTELLLSSRLGDLFSYLENKEAFDYIIADTAPIQPVTDAYIISEFCDTTLFVVRHRYTPKAMIKLLDENNKIKALKNLNIVFNAVRSRGIFNKGFGYGYGYGYEYGYADRKYIGHSDKD